MTHVAPRSATSRAGGARPRAVAWSSTAEHDGGSAIASAPWPSLSADSRPACCFSVDFEDFLHDFQRTLGVSRPRQAEPSLWKAYRLIDDFARTSLAGARLTFFTTGQVARDYSDVVRQIAADGHEIACHYLEHDQIWHQTRATFRKNLERAVEHLTKTSGQTIKGFRAPDFSIDRRCADWAYEELSRLFSYDSSFVTSDRRALSGSPPAFHFPGRVLYEAPIFAQRVLPGLDIRVIGGSFLRLLPSTVVHRLLRRALASGFMPQVYVHPYDILHDYEQWSTDADLAELSLRARHYWRIRQHQWHSIGNRGALPKLRSIYREFAHPGTMASLFCGNSTVIEASAPSDGRGRATASAELHASPDGAEVPSQKRNAP